MIKSQIVAFTALIVAAQAVEAQLYFSRDSNSELYRLDTNNAAATLVATTGTFGSTVGLTETNDPNVLLGSTWSDLTRIDISAGTHTIVGGISGRAEGLAWDPTTSTLYGYINTNFFTLNPATAAQTATLASTPVEVEGLAWRNGFVFGFGGTDTNLYRYSIIADVWSLVGDTGLPFPDSTGLAYDPTNDVFYTKSENSGNLYRIDPLSASATLIGDTGILQGGGLAFVVVPEPSSCCLCLAAFWLLFTGRRQNMRR